MRIDSHQHFWKYDPQQYPWMKPGWPIRRDFLPDDLQPLLSAGQLDGSIVVQARQSLEETQWLLELADSSEKIKGVVGWVDLRSAAAEEQLVQFSADPKFVGVRHVVQDETDPNFMLGREFQRGISKLFRFGLVYDILIYHHQLPAAITLAKTFPDQPFVLDHIAKPAIASGNISPWRDQIKELARCSNVACKVSGLITEADHASWKMEDFAPYLDVIFDSFGVDRLLFGSDWPVCLLAGNYDRVLELAQHYTRQFNSSDLGKFYGGNAARIYPIG